MNDLTLVLAAAALTYISRAAAVAVLPQASGRVLEFIDRLPAPLFAGLAVFALVGSPPTMPDWPSFAAAIGALGAAPKRSLGLTLAVGLAAYALVAWLL
jgi:branched-subunit amino acid transport protein